MEMDLQTIIDKLKKEGVDEADKKAAERIKEAEGKAAGIIEAAKKEKEMMLENARQETEKMKKNGEDALEQASRDVMLALKDRIIALFDNVLKKKVSEALTPETIAVLVGKMAENIGTDKEKGLEVLVSEKEKDTISRALMGELKKELAGGTVVKASPSIKTGFRIGTKGENSYYDVTDEAVAESFKTFLNPRIKEVLDGGETTA